MGNKEDMTRTILDRMRMIMENREQEGPVLINEENERKSSAIAITDDPRFGQNALTSQIEQFRASVEGGAQFSKPSENVSECPLIYLPDTGNLVFSGTIPCLNNLKWQFVLKTNTGNGCFIWSDGMILSKENMQILSKLQGFYENWRDQWNQEAADLERMAENLKNAF